MYIGASEVLFIVLITLILLGPNKLPEIARLIGRAYGQIEHFIREVHNYLLGNVEEVKNTILSREELETLRRLALEMSNRRYKQS